LQTLKTSINIKTRNPKFPFDSTSDECNVKKFQIESLKESWEFHHQNKEEIDFDYEIVEKTCQKLLKRYSNKAKILWKIILEETSSSEMIPSA
jgi:hypothetical protein